MADAARVSTIALVLLSAASPVDAQWIIAAYGGAVHTRPADIHIRQDRTTLDFPGVSFASQSFQSPIYYGYRAARVIAPGRGVFIEGELIHAKVFADGTRATGSGVRDGVPVQAIPFSSVIQRFAISHGLNFVLVNAGLRYRVSERMALAARAGGGPMIPHAETEIDGRVHEGYELAGVGVQASGGIEVRLWRGVSVLTEYKWTHAHPHVSLGEGKADLATTSHHVAVGISVMLGR